MVPVRTPRWIKAMVTRALYQVIRIQITMPMIEAIILMRERAFGFSELITMSTLTCPFILSSQAVPKKVINNKL